MWLQDKKINACTFLNYRCPSFGLIIIIIIDGSWRLEETCCHSDSSE